jgi:hypothetical protein
MTELLEAAVLLLLDDALLVPMSEAVSFDGVDMVF